MENANIQWISSTKESVWQNKEVSNRGNGDVNLAITDETF